MSRIVSTQDRQRSCNFEIEGVKTALGAAFEAERARRPEWADVPFGEPGGAGLTLSCHSGEKRVIAMSLMYAHGSHRGKGLARWMLDALVRLCEARGLDLELRARKDDAADLGHLALVDIYQEAGFEFQPVAEGEQPRMRKPKAAAPRA